MQKSLFQFMLMLSTTTCIGQDYVFEYPEDNKPTITKTSVKAANYIGEIMPNIWRNLGLAYKERVELDLILDYFHTIQRRGTHVVD